DDQLVRDELPGVHVTLGLLTQRGPVFDIGPQHVAGGDVGQLEVGPQAVSLGSLARARWAEQDQIELGHDRPLYRDGRAGRSLNALRPASVPARPIQCLPPCPLAVVPLSLQCAPTRLLDQDYGPFSGFAPGSHPSLLPSASCALDAPDLASSISWTSSIHPLKLRPC